MPERRLSFPRLANRILTNEPTEAHTDQADLIQTLRSTMTDETASAVKAQGKPLAGSQGIDAALAKNEIDLIIGPGDCEIAQLPLWQVTPKQWFQ